MQNMCMHSHDPKLLPGPLLKFSSEKHPEHSSNVAQADHSKNTCS